MSSEYPPPTPDTAVGPPDPHFTFAYLHRELSTVLAHGYSIITCNQYFELDKKSDISRTMVLRVDVDMSLQKCRPILEILRELCIKATFFLRLHAPEYNPFSFDGYLVVREIINDGHELGYHSEVMDQAFIWNEDPADCLRRDLTVMESVFGQRIHGCASHGGITGVNNLDFWTDRRPSEYGLHYEAYDKGSSFGLFNSSLYVSDSEWTRWKSYRKGELVAGDRRSPSEYAATGEELIYCLMHPDTYFHKHRYEL